MMSNLVPGFIRRFGERLRFPYLFLLTVLVFGLDLFIPDMIPFIDEIALGLAAVVLGRWKKRKTEKRSLPDNSPKERT